MFSALQIREGRVKSISAKAAGELKQDGWVFLDVRPPPEIEKVRRSLMPQDDPAFLHLSHPCMTLKNPCNAFELLFYHSLVYMHHSWHFLLHVSLSAGTAHSSRPEQKDHLSYAGSCRRSSGGTNLHP